MKFFKNQSPRFRRSGAYQKGAAITITSRADQEDDGSFGSELSLKDQFDILVRPKPKKLSGWRLFEKDDSTCSSITADDKRYYHMDSSDPNYQHPMLSSIAAKKQGSTSWCCCSGTRATDPTIDTDNTLLAQGKGGIETIPPVLSTPADDSQQGCCSLTCCPGSARQSRPVLERPDTETKVIGKKVPMREGASLFDTLSEDGDERKSGESRRKWRPRRLWKKRQQ